VIVVLPAPDGPTSAVSCLAGAVKLTSCSTPRLASVRSGCGSAMDSSDASDTSDGGGYRNETCSKAMSAGPPGPDPLSCPATTSGSAPGLSSISGFRSSTSNTRSKLTSAVITLIWTLDSAVIGP